MSTPKTFGFVVWPEVTENMHYGREEDYPASGICDTGEGGLECWLIACADRHYDDVARHVRDVCITGFVPAIVEFDVVPDGWLQREWAETQQEHWRGERQAAEESSVPMPVDAAVCIGATQRCPWDYRTRDYWRPSPWDLTDDGRKLYTLMQDLYGVQAVHIVMALDT